MKSRTSDGNPATGEVRQLVEQVAKLQTFVGAHSTLTMTNWEAVQTSLGKLQQAFGLDAVTGAPSLDHDVLVDGVDQDVVNPNCSSA